MNLREPEDNVVPVTGLTETLSVIPYMVGFHPHESMVAVCLHGERQRSGLVLRIDLPEPVDEARWVDELVARVQHQNADGVLLACYTDRPDCGGVRPFQELVDSLCTALDEHEVRVTQAALVRAGRWWSLACPDPTCCPPDGTELPATPRGAPTRFGAEAALAGRTVFASREALEATVCGPSADQLVEVRHYFDIAAAALRDECETVGRRAARARTVELTEQVAAAYTTGERALSAADAARICVGLIDRQARDQVASLSAPEPGAWLALLGELVRRTPDEFAAPVCTVLAWTAYQYGEGALANVALDRALTCRPGYRMALMLRDSLDRQVSPEVIRETSRAVRSSRHVA